MAVRSVRRAFAGVLVVADADEPVGLLAEWYDWIRYGVDGLFDDFPNQLAQFVFHGLPSDMIEHGT